MYGLPHNFDASFFVGRTLELLCFAIYQVHFHFDEHIQIVALSPFYFGRNTEPRGPIEFPIVETRLMVCLEQKVSDVASSVDGTLTLTFDNGYMLTCLNHSKQYESYHIVRGDQTLVV
jgi:hypothetical protein